MSGRIAPNIAAGIVCLAIDLENETWRRITNQSKWFKSYHCMQDLYVVDHSFTKCIIHYRRFSSSLPGQNGCHFEDDILKCIFVNKNVWISINISLKFIDDSSQFISCIHLCITYEFIMNTGMLYIGQTCNCLVFKYLLRPFTMKSISVMTLDFISFEYLVYSCNVIF